MRHASIFMAAAFLSACGEGGGDGKASTYDTCRITASSALFASDRANDLRQCWSIVPTKNSTNALAQCQAKVNAYMNRYVFGHEISYAVSSSTCP